MVSPPTDRNSTYNAGVPVREAVSMYITWHLSGLCGAHWSGVAGSHQIQRPSPGSWECLSFSWWNRTRERPHLQYLWMMRWENKRMDPTSQWITFCRPLAAKSSAVQPDELKGSTEPVCHTAKSDPRTNPRLVKANQFIAPKSLE